MSLTEPIRNQHQVRQFINYFYQTGQLRNYVLATLCVHTALRISDILSLSCNQVYDFQNRRPRKSITITEQKTGKAITRVQAYRLLRSAAEVIRLEQRVSSHSLRKTFGYHAWRGGISPAVIMEIYNHSSLAVTRRYLGVTQDDMNAVYQGISFE